MHLRSHFFFTLLSALALAVLPVAPTTAGAADAEYASVGMPFTGRWANTFATAPWEHPASHGDWSMDIYATDRAVHAVVPAASGEVELRVTRVSTPRCTPTAGEEVEVVISVDGTELGYVTYMHLTDVVVEAGEIIENGARLGRTIAVDENFGYGGCWQVQFPKTGIHVHFEMGGVASSCHVKYDKGAELAYATPIGQVGAIDPISCVTGLGAIDLPDEPSTGAVDPADAGQVSRVVPFEDGQVHVTGYSSGEYADLAVASEKLELQPEEIQLAGVQVIRFLNGLTGVDDPVDLDPVPSTDGDVVVRSDWSGAGEALTALEWVTTGYAITPSEAQKFGATLLVFFSGLD